MALFWSIKMVIVTEEVSDLPLSKNVLTIKPKNIEAVA